MELEKSAEQVLPARKRRRVGQGQEREMTQTMYAHVNKRIIIKKTQAQGLSSNPSNDNNNNNNIKQNG
jgi:hypothetical protein